MYRRVASQDNELPEPSPGQLGVVHADNENSQLVALLQRGEYLEWQDFEYNIGADVPEMCKALNPGDKVSLIDILEESGIVVVDRVKKEKCYRVGEMIPILGYPYLRKVDPTLAKPVRKVDEEVYLDEDISDLKKYIATVFSDSKVPEIKKPDVDLPKKSSSSKSGSSSSKSRSGDKPEIDIGNS